MLSLAFEQTERDILDQTRYLMRESHFRWLSLLPLVLTTALSVVMLIGRLQDAGGLIAFLLAVGAIISAGLWFLGPQASSATLMRIREVNGQQTLPFEITVTSAGVETKWAQGATSLAWAAMRDILVIDDNIYIRAKKPWQGIWLPARGFLPGQRAALLGIAREAMESSPHT